MRDVLNRVFATHGISLQFALLVPVAGQPPHYRLYLQVDELIGMSDLPGSMASAAESGLEENPYYRHAVQRHQLSRLDVCVLDASSEPGWLVYKRVCLARGQKARDIAPQR